MPPDTVHVLDLGCGDDPWENWSTYHLHTAVRHLLGARYRDALLEVCGIDHRLDLDLDLRAASRHLVADNTHGIAYRRSFSSFLQTMPPCEYPKRYDLALWLYPPPQFVGALAGDDALAGIDAYGQYSAELAEECRLQIQSVCQIVCLSLKSHGLFVIRSEMGIRRPPLAEQAMAHLAQQMGYVRCTPQTDAALFQDNAQPNFSWGPLDHWGEEPAQTWLLRAPSDHADVEV